MPDILRTTDLVAFFSQHGIKGSIEITHIHESDNSTKGTITFDLDTLMDVEQASYNWAVYELPVEYTQAIGCDKGYLGDK